MRERPILFSAPMVRPILTGQKTQTRRAVKLNDAGRVQLATKQWHIDDSNVKHACPYGQPGDRLWVRESFSPYIYREGCWYWADGNMAAYDCEKPKPSIHMPRWASRITLEITGVRVERLQDISEADAQAEGVTVEDHHKGGYCAGEFLPPAVRAFRELWESINGASAWETNPWVWVVEFRRLADG